MKIAAFWLMIAFVLPLVVPGSSGVAMAGADIEAAESLSDLEVLQRRLDALQSMQADFQQVMYNAEQEATRTSSGRFSLLRPGRFRWDYEEPFEQSIVADGKQLWIYDADLEQVTVRQMDTGLGSTPAMLLSGAADVGEAYSVASRFNADGIEWLELEPRASDSDFGKVRLGFDSEQLAVMDLIDSLGQTTRIVFSAVQHNPELGESRFEFAVPAGADVIRADDL